MGATLLVSRLFAWPWLSYLTFLWDSGSTSKMGIKYVLTAYGVIRIKWICVNALSRVLGTWWIINVSYFSPSIFIQQSMVLSPDPQKLHRVIFGGHKHWGNFWYLVGGGYTCLSRKGQHCTTKSCPLPAHIGTYTQVPVVSPLRINALLQIFIKLIMSSYITLVPYLHNAFDSYFLFCQCLSICMTLSKAIKHINNYS